MGVEIGYPAVLCVGVLWCPLLQLSLYYSIMSDGVLVMRLMKAVFKILWPSSFSVYTRGTCCFG